MIRPLLLDVLTGRKSLNQVISGSGLPLAAHSIVAVRERSTTFSWGPMSIVGNPGGSWSSGKISCVGQTELAITHTFRLTTWSNGFQPVLSTANTVAAQLEKVYSHLYHLSQFKYAKYEIKDLKVHNVIPTLDIRHGNAGTVYIQVSDACRADTGHFHHLSSTFSFVL